MDQDGNARICNGGQFGGSVNGVGGGSSASSPREGSPEVVFRFARSHHHHASNNGGHSNEETSHNHLQSSHKKLQQQQQQQQMQRKQSPQVCYRECQKNHAANIGGHAIDGCGEFLPSGKEGSLEALICAVCSCHRNFHRREFVGPDGEYTCTCGGIGKDSGISGSHTTPLAPSIRPSSPRVHEAKVHSHPHHYQQQQQQQQQQEQQRHLLSANVPSHAQMIMPLARFDGQHYEDADVDDHDEDADDDDDDEPPDHPRPSSSSFLAKNKKTKRFRTKFTCDQKERMSSFAETLGWRISKQDEALLLEFCNDVGVKRNVFKVWMHNNKPTSARKQAAISEHERSFDSPTEY